MVIDIFCQRLQHFTAHSGCRCDFVQCSNHMITYVCKKKKFYTFSPSDHRREMCDLLGFSLHRLISSRLSYCVSYYLVAVRFHCDSVYYSAGTVNDSGFLSSVD